MGTGNYNGKELLNGVVVTASLPRFKTVADLKAALDSASTLLKDPDFRAFYGLPTGEAFSKDTKARLFVLNEVVNFIGPNRLREDGYNSAQEYLRNFSDMRTLRDAIEKDQSGLLLELLNRGLEFKTRHTDNISQRAADVQYLRDLVSQIGRTPEMPYQNVQRFIDMLYVAAKIKPYVDDYLGLRIEPKALSANFLRDNPDAREVLFMVAGEFHTRGMDKVLGLDKINDRTAVNRPVLGKLALPAAVALMQKNDRYDGTLSLDTMAHFLKLFGRAGDADFAAIHDLRVKASKFGLPDQAKERYSMPAEAMITLELILFGHKVVQDKDYHLDRLASQAGARSALSDSVITYRNPDSNQVIEDKYERGIIRSKSVSDSNRFFEPVETRYDKEGFPLERGGDHNRVTIQNEAATYADLQSALGSQANRLSGIPWLKANTKINKVTETDQYTHEVKVTYRDLITGDAIVEVVNDEITLIADAGINTVTDTWLSMATGRASRFTMRRMTSPCPRKTDAGGAGGRSLIFRRTVPRRNMRVRTAG